MVETPENPNPEGAGDDADTAADTADQSTTRESATVEVTRESTVEDKRLAGPRGDPAP